MNSFFDSLPSDVARFLSLWKRVIITETEASGGLLDRFTFSLMDRPDAVEVIESILHTVPSALLLEMERQLVASQTSEGGWRWPPGGPGLGDPYGSAPWGYAEPAESAAMECLLDCLRNQSRESSLPKETEQRENGST